MPALDRNGYTPFEMPVLPVAERIEHAERLCSVLRIDIRHGVSQACYIPSKDYVQMPAFTCFRDAITYYAVLLHECGHASGAKHRLDRDLSGRFGSAAYAMEECTVELLSAMICADLNLSVDPPVMDEASESIPAACNRLAWRPMTSLTAGHAPG